MKIIRKDKDSLVSFGSLRTGDVFIETVEGDEYIQMKTSLIETEDEGIYNAVSLVSGEMYYIGDTELVRLVSGEVTIS